MRKKNKGTDNSNVNRPHTLVDIQMNNMMLLVSTEDEAKIISATHMEEELNSNELRDALLDSNKTDEEKNQVLVNELERYAKDVMHSELKKISKDEALELQTEILAKQQQEDINKYIKEHSKRIYWNLGFYIIDFTLEPRDIHLIRMTFIDLFLYGAWVYMVGATGLTTMKTMFNMLFIFINYMNIFKLIMRAVEEAGKFLED